MVLDPIPQSLPVHFFGSRPQPPTSLSCISLAYATSLLHLSGECKESLAYMLKRLLQIAKSPMCIPCISLASEARDSLSQRVSRVSLQRVSCVSLQRVPCISLAREARDCISLAFLSHFSCICRYPHRDARLVALTRIS